MLTAAAASHDEGRHGKKEGERRPSEALPWARGGKVQEPTERQIGDERPCSHAESAREAVAPMARAAKYNECRSNDDDHGDRTDDAKLWWESSVDEATLRGSAPWGTECQPHQEDCDQRSLPPATLAVR